MQPVQEKVNDKEIRNQPLSGETHTTKSRKGYSYLKRMFDVVFSVVAGVVFLIPCAIAALMIAIKDPGNPFYIQKRVGQYGNPLYIAKLRTMRKGADNIESMLSPEQLREYKQEYKLDDDPRLIGYKKPGDGKRCFGAILRRLSIDELPQIYWNILIKGNMSVVGPRPILQSELEENYTPEQQRRLLSVKPGLTGYWQAYARNNARYENGEGARQGMELHYVEHMSLMFDLKIVLRTVKEVLLRDGAK